MTHITGRAPGKLVLSGDYIALLDAPALVLAVNCVASAILTPKVAGGWSIRSNIASDAEYDSLTSLLDSGDQQLLDTLISALPTPSTLPEHAELELDTSAFYENTNKLGVGSSAAILVALAEALGHVTGHRFTTKRLIELHNSLHGKNGSGLDIVAAKLGGLTRFQNGAGVRVKPPSGLNMRFVFTGTSTSTEPMLLKFRTLVERRSEEEVVNWQKLATAVAESLHEVKLFLRNLAKLNQFVFEFDQRTQLGIYGSAHRTALEIGNDVGVLYKPCGAGGGDTGVALSDDPKALDAFERTVTRKGLNLLNLKVENHGATVQL
ncbi:MAG: hypothetical protein OXG15_03470 [Gammaproteobacteria bacterium]|nr:hypothetical protein [Gammaproteobacteria bacterium]